jgi:hypothetical protein
MLHSVLQGCRVELIKLQDALAEAQEGLRNVDADFKLLGKRKEQLERLVFSLTEVLTAPLPAGTGALALATPTPKESVPADGSPKAVWQLAQDVLMASGRPLTVPDIVAVLETKGIVVDSETVRVALYRKTEIFSKSERGRYGLKAWDSSLVLQPAHIDTDREEINW